MSLPFTTLGEVTGSIQSGSYLSEQDVSLLFVSQSKDIWFGFSVNDAIEISVFDTTNLTPISWSVINQNKEFRTATSTFLDAINRPQTYTYSELVSPFILYKKDSILLNVVSDLSSIGVNQGNFETSYIFTRQLAGNPNNPLTIKDISPSRTEIKLIPATNADASPTSSYTSFCLKKFPLRDVAPLLLTVTSQLPYDQVFKSMPQSVYSGSIEFLQSIFFLPDNGSIQTFLKNLYEDFVKYTALTETQIGDGLDPTQISRIQGIKTYFSNFIIQNYDSIADFSDLEKKFSDFVNIRLDQRFIQFKGQTGSDYLGARQFCYDFFFKYFYQPVVLPLKVNHTDKYFSYFKNVLNFGENKYFPILDTNFLDERKSPTDPLTLLVKLGSELPSDINQKATCWVSNFSMAPYVFTTIVQNPSIFKTTRISAPNFGATSQFITRENINKLYSSDDLELSDTTQDEVTVNKNVSALNTDFSNFSNFIIFSSAASRLAIFKNKVVNWTNLSSSLVDLNAKYNLSLSSSIIYPYFSNEADTISGQMSDIIQSFDAYESYLFKNNGYKYSSSSGSFISSSFVSENDTSAMAYDKNNRDSLINNTPEFILNDTNNEEYLTFLAMMGHNFDNIYTYISALPIERQVKNEISSSLPTNTLKEMLYSFGWNPDDIINSLDVDDVYLNSVNSTIYNSLSAEERLKIIWNRILVTLPALYKSKGTEECVQYLLSCYGLPSSLISIREYGGTDFSENPQPTYRLDEKTYMLRFSGPNDYIEGPFPSYTKTVELKFGIESTSSYRDFSLMPLFVSIPHPHTGNPAFSAWSLNLYKVPGQYAGQIIFRMESGSTGTVLTSSTLPLFNGDIFSVMLRRNEPNPQFESNINLNAPPIEYDLVVQRNEDGRKIFYSTSSINMFEQDNAVFSQFGRFRLGNGVSYGTFVGTLDKLSLWDIPIDDVDFEEHVDDINSYGFSGSNAFQNIWVRLNWDYPQSMYYNISGSSAVWVDNRSPHYAIPNYHTDAKNISSSINTTLYAAAQDIVSERWVTLYPTGSVDTIAYNFPIVVNPNWTSSLVGCNIVSSSQYPYHFRESTYQQDIDASKYGPNKYKNKKIRRVNYEIEARLDSNDKSANPVDITISGESNQLGFFIDPQDSKNKDIIRYTGRVGIMNLISDPSNLYSDQYYDLKNKNFEYNYNGNKRVYFNELLTVYKFYFDKSIFQAIKNILPARANIFTGVVVEPTILERPKYQNRQITSSALTTYEAGTIGRIARISSSALWTDFNTDFSQFTSQSQALIKNTLPPNYQQVIDLTYINNPLYERSPNLFMGYITDFPDNVQEGIYGDYEGMVRQWDVLNNDGVWIYGSISQKTPSDLASIAVPVMNSNFDRVSPNTGSHQILYYMLKVWDKYTYYRKDGPYSRTSNPAENQYSSASVSLYKYIVVTEPFMRRLTYFYNKEAGSATDPSPVYFNGAYTHSVNTFRNTPNATVSNVFAFNIDSFNPSVFQYGVSPVPQYFELVKGYPRNHHTHKSKQFSKDSFVKFINFDSGSLYVKGRQTIDTTVADTGINDGSSPVQSTNVSNVNVVNTSNILEQ